MTGQASTPDFPNLSGQNDVTASMERQDELAPAMAGAVEWAVRLSSGEVTDEDAQEFRQWFGHSPDHADAWRILNSVRPAGRAIATKAQNPQTMSRRALLVAGGTSLAVLSIVSITRPPLGLWPSLAELMADHRTGTAQHYAFAPMTGVKVELNARTSVGLLDAGHGLNLIDGEAFISIASTEPFRVEAGGGRIEASLASFNIETLAGKLRLTCSSGQVRCTAGERTETLGPRDHLSITSTGALTRSKAEPAEIASWRHGRLVFNGAPLSDVIARLNRYRSGAIILSDASKGSIPISAHFFTARIDDAVPQLVTLLGLSARHLPGNVVLLG